MPDLKTVTFDASQWQIVPKVPTEEMLDAASRASMQHLIDCLNDPEKAKEIGSEENVRKTHASRYQSLLAAAPTPAAQSAGQEAVISEFKRIAHELRTYDPRGDEYHGAHIHKVWAKEVDVVLAYIDAPVGDPVMGAFRVLLAACNRLWAEAEEVDTADGHSQVALQQYWDAFIDARDKAQEAISAAPVNGGERDAIEAEQRVRMNERLANRKPTPATADFDLPAPNDGIAEQTPCYQCKGCGDSEYGAWRCVRCDGTGFERAADAPQSGGDSRANEVAELAPILRGMIEGGSYDDPAELYAADFEALDGDVFVRRAADLLEEYAALTSPAKVGEDRRELFAKWLETRGISGEMLTASVHPFEAFKGGMQARAALSADGGEEANLEGLRDKLFDGRPVTRDAEGWYWHPAMPDADEDVNYGKLLTALRIEAVFVSMEVDDSEAADRYGEAGEADCHYWTPTPPEGDGWHLLAVYDTEDGPYALFGRDAYVAEQKRKQERTRQMAAAIAANQAKRDAQ